MLSKVGALAALALAFHLHAQPRPSVKKLPAKAAPATATTTATAPDPLAPLEIVKVVPDRATIGEPIKIFINREIWFQERFWKLSATDRAGQLLVSVGGQQADISFASAKLITATVPKRVLAGKQKVVVLFNSVPSKNAGELTIETDEVPIPIPRPIKQKTPTIGPPQEKPFDWLSLAAWALVAVVTVGGLAFSKSQQKQARQLEAELQRSRYQFNNLRIPLDAIPDEADETEIDLPEIPRELIDACVAKECVLFAGQGLDLISGYPDWRELLTGVIPDTRSDLLEGVKSGYTDAVVEILLAEPATRERLLAATMKAHNLPPRITQELFVLREIPFSSAITTSWSHLLPTLFRSREPVEAIISDDRQSVDLLTGQRFAIVRLFGSATKKESIILSRAQLREQIMHNALYAKYLTSLLATKTHLFIGASVATIDEYLSALNWVRSRRHFAVLGADRALRFDRERLKARYGVELIEVPRSQEWLGTRRFAVELANEFKRVARPGPARLSDDALLRHVSLINIGPFSSLDIDLEGPWTVILGNNASGKSSVLRAIAMALAGEDPRAAVGAERLLKSGESRGSVELTIGREIYRADLVRELSNVRVICRQLTPLQAGRALILGFPAMRGGSGAASAGPSDRGSLSVEVLPYPDVADVLPLVTGDSDTRLDSLKQWVINLEARSSIGIVPKRDLREKFFSVLNELIPGLQCTLERVEFNTWQVYVKTADGVVPIDHVSQGMISVISWVGTLLQRLYSVRSSSKDPTKEEAIVLIDEIDAHLHPRWQQLIVGLLKKQFPRVQFIATTHSPLIVAELRREEVLVAQRSDEGSRIVIEQVPLHFEGLRVDQILTSPLFDLTTTRGFVPRYQELLAKSDRTLEEETELANLRESLGSIAQTPEDRKVESEWKETLNRLTSEDGFAELLGGGKMNDEVRDKLMRALRRPPENQ